MQRYTGLSPCRYMLRIYQAFDLNSSCVAKARGLAPRQTIYLDFREPEVLDPKVDSAYNHLAIRTPCHSPWHAETILTARKQSTTTCRNHQPFLQSIALCFRGQQSRLKALRGCRASRLSRDESTQKMTSKSGLRGMGSEFTHHWHVRTLDSVR